MTAPCDLCGGAGDLPDPGWRGSHQDPDMPTHPCGACAGRGHVDGEAWRKYVKHEREGK